jgi:hypothetical protein
VYEPVGWVKRSATQQLLSGFALLYPDLPTNQYLKNNIDWLLHMLEKRAEIDAETRAWDGEDIVDFERTFESTPHSSDALF